MDIIIFMFMSLVALCTWAAAFLWGRPLVAAPEDGGEPVLRRERWVFTGVSIIGGIILSLLPVPPYPWFLRVFLFWGLPVLLGIALRQFRKYPIAPAAQQRPSQQRSAPKPSSHKRPPRKH